jgi:hypothetical protein
MKFLKLSYKTVWATALEKYFSGNKDFLLKFPSYNTIYFANILEQIPLRTMFY